MKSLRSELTQAQLEAIEKHLETAPPVITHPERAILPEAFDVDHEGQPCYRPKGWCYYCDQENMRRHKGDAE